MHSLDGTGGIFLFQNMLQLGENPFAGKTIEKSHADSVADQIVGHLADFKPKTLFKADGAKNPGGIFHKTEVVQHPYRFFFNIFTGSEKIDQRTEMVGRYLQGQGVDGKIATKQIEFDGTDGHFGQSGRVGVVFHAGGGDIDLKPIGQHHHGRTEFGVGMHTPLKLLGQEFCRQDSVTFNHDIDILI